MCGLQHQAVLKSCRTTVLQESGVRRDSRILRSVIRLTVAGIFPLCIMGYVVLGFFTKHTDNAQATPISA